MIPPWSRQPVFAGGHATIATAALLVAAALGQTGASAANAARRRTIVVIWGDGVGPTNLSICSRGLMGCRTPGKEGVAFIDRAHAARKAFFIWFATTRMPTFTRVPERYREQATRHTSHHDDHAAGVIQHDEHVGVVLARLDEPGTADDTIVISSTDNGVEHSTCPHGGTTAFRSGKMSTAEEGVRVPMLVRWPGRVPAGAERNGIQGREDVFTTLAAAAGVPDIRERIAKGDTLRLGRHVASLREYPPKHKGPRLSEGE